MYKPQEPRTTFKRVNATSQGKLFISYRRVDSAAIAGRIRDWLTQRIPVENVFYDVETIEYGADFERRIAQAVPQCRAMLAIIGPQWLDPQGGPSPYIRLELELALRAGVPIIPVLVEGATMPSAEQLPDSLKAVHKLNAAQVRSGHDFSHDMGELAAVLRIPVKPRTEPALHSPRFWLIAAIAVALLAVGVAGVIGLEKIASNTQATLTNAERNQTATAEHLTAATASAAAATATAGHNATATAIAAAPFSHVAAAPGPNCDPSGQWTLEEASATAGSLTCQTNSTLIRADTNNPVYLIFTGASNFAFAAPFTAAVDASNMQGSCANLSFSYTPQNTTRGDSYNLKVCDDASWVVTGITQGVSPSAPGATTTIASSTNPGSTPIARSTTYHLAVSSTGLEEYFSVNGTTVAMVPVAVKAPSSFGIADDATYSSNVGGGVLDFANFNVTPQALH